MDCQKGELSYKCKPTVTYEQQKGKAGNSRCTAGEQLDNGKLNV